MKKYFLLATCCLIAIKLHAQIATDEEPYGLKDGFRVQAQDAVVLEIPDLARIEKEDLENDQQPGPIRYACPVFDGLFRQICLPSYHPTQVRQ